MPKYAALVILENVGAGKDQRIHDMVFVDASDEKTAVHAITVKEDWPLYLGWHKKSVCRIVKIFDLDSDYAAKRLIVVERTRRRRRRSEPEETGGTEPKKRRRRSRRPSDG